MISQRINNSGSLANGKNVHFGAYIFPESSRVELQKLLSPTSDTHFLKSFVGQSIIADHYGARPYVPTVAVKKIFSMLGDNDLLLTSQELGYLKNIESKGGQEFVDLVSQFLNNVQQLPQEIRDNFNKIAEIKKNAEETIAKLQGEAKQQLTSLIG